MEVKIAITLVLLILLGPAHGWYYNCFVESNVLMQGGCSMLDFVITPRTEVDNIFFPPADINFFRSNFSSFSPALGRRFGEETEKINLYNCVLPSLAVPLMVKQLGVFFASSLQTVLVNYRLENALEYLSIVGTGVRDIRFVEALTKLKFLRVQKNRLSFVNFERFRNLTDLETIDLSENQLIHLDVGQELLKLPKLIELRLDKNYLAQFDVGMWSFPNLLFLKIHYNLIKSLNVEQLVDSLPNLSQISLAANPWNCGRLNTMVSYLLENNINYQEEAGKLSCRFNLMETIIFTTQDNVTHAERILSHMNETAAVYYLDAKSAMLEDVGERNEVLIGEIRHTSAGLNELETRVNKLRISIQELKFKNKIPF
ncbi:prolargin-like isoform X1 [Culex pipiens pallens]|uniref:prolargin-like isoform X1 n=2 Tax=Culex pipiens pallens TaxID=42434 RepID=UPI0022AB3AB2|nr:prolargin-like isoform X1 [Culex pipiens pallens]